MRVAWRVVIAGGGFGGFYTARTLENIVPPYSTRITLINDSNFLLYTPLLPAAAGAVLDRRNVVVPLRSQLPGTDLLVGRVTAVDTDRRTVSVERVDGEQLVLEYDQLVLALGSISRTLPIPGLSEHGLGLKSLADATALRNRILTCLDIAESVEEHSARGRYLSFVFVGAGYAGVEGLAELEDFAAQVIRLYPRSRTQGMRWMLVEARDQIMPEVPRALSEFAARELRGRGIEIRVGTTLERITDEWVTLSSGEEVGARTVVWTAGVRPSPVVARIGLELDPSGRIVTDSTMRVPGHANVWAIGDCAAVPDPARKGQPSPPTAQHAMRQGRRLAANIAAVLGSGTVRPFRYKTRGMFAELGHRQAVAITLGVRWRGLPAWLLARSYHLLMMPGLSRKLRLLVDWNVALFFGRDASAPSSLARPLPLEHGDLQRVPEPAPRHEEPETAPEADAA